MRYRKAILLLFLLTASAYSGLAQQQIFKTYTFNDGMISNYVRRIYQDTKGFLWIATPEGISKYDGNKFTNYSTSNGLSHNLVNDIHESPDGKLYIACNDGSIQVINENETIERVSLSPVIINRFCKTMDGQIIAATDQNGLQQFSNAQLVKPIQASPLANYYDLAELGDSLFVTSTEYSLQLLNKRYELFSELNRVSPEYAECRIYSDSKKRIWVGSGQGLQLLSSIQKKNNGIEFEPLPPQMDLPLVRQNKITEIFEDRNRNLWVGTSCGLFKFDPSGSWEQFDEKNGLPSHNITCIYQDREYNIWIGTFLGLTKLVTQNSTRVYTTNNGLLSNSCGGLYPLNNGNMLVYTEQGLQVWEKENSRFQPLLSKSKTSYYGFASNSQSPLLFAYNKLGEYDDKLKTINVEHTLNHIRGTIFCVSRDRDNNLFIGTDSGLFRYNATNEEKLIGGRIEEIIIDNNGRLWAGTWEKGLYCFQYGIMNNKLTIASKENVLPGKYIRSLHEDKQGNIWVGTRYDGVYRVTYGPAKKYHMQQFDKTTGLTSNWITGIVEGTNGSIWLCFYQGLDKLVRYNADSFRVFNFSRVNNYFSSINSIAVDSDKYLWVSSNQGIAAINDGQIENSEPLPVYITSISMADTTYKFRTKDPIIERKLTHRQNQIEFEFAAPGFINEKQVLYSYRLSGRSNTSWSQPANQHSVSYASLQPGEYIFEVRTLGWNGKWGKPTSFKFSILPSFWQTWWFITICALVALTVIYWIIKKRIAGIRQQAEMKNKIAETEMMALRAQMNPHFIFNCMNSIDALIQSNDKYNATVYLNKFAKLIRNILDSSKQNLVPLTRDMETLQLYTDMEQFRNENRFEVDIKVDKELLQDDHRVPPLIIQPYVENAILHGLRARTDQGGKLSVSVTRQNEFIRFVIQDNGIGRLMSSKQKRNEKKSYGIQMSSERVKLFNKERIASVYITDLEDTGNSTGTKVEVLLKIQ